MTEKEKETYSTFVSEISEILGLGKPVDIITLFVIIDHFFSPLQNQLEELQEENERLKKESEENQDLATIAYMQGAEKYKAKLDEAKELLRKCRKYHFHSEVIEYPYSDVEAFLRSVENERF